MTIPRVLDPVIIDKCPEFRHTGKTGLVLSGDDQQVKIAVEGGEFCTCATDDVRSVFGTVVPPGGHYGTNQAWVCAPTTQGKS